MLTYATRPRAGRNKETWLTSQGGALVCLFCLPRHPGEDLVARRREKKKKRGDSGVWESWGAKHGGRQAEGREGEEWLRREWAANLS